MRDAQFVVNDEGVITPHPSVIDGTPKRLGQIGSGTSPGDAVNRSQLDLRSSETLSSATDYVDTLAQGTPFLASTEDISATELGFGRNHVTRLGFTALVIGQCPGAALDKAFGFLLGDFPGPVLFTGCRIHLESMAFNGTDTSVTFALGSEDAAGEAVSVPSDSSNPLVYNLSTEDVAVGSKGGDADGIVATSVSESTLTSLYLNFGATWDADNVGDIAVEGTILISWTDMST